MSKWEDNIREKFDDFEGDVSSDAWDAIAQRLDMPFESGIKQKVGNFEAPPHPALWASISSQLPGSFDGKLADKLSDYSASPMNNVWDGIESKMNKSAHFDDKITAKVRNIEGTPPANAWKYISRALDRAIAARRRRRILTLAAIFLGAIIPSSNLIYHWIGNDSAPATTASLMEKDQLTSPSDDVSGNDKTRKSTLPNKSSDPSFDSHEPKLVPTAGSTMASVPGSGNSKSLSGLLPKGSNTRPSRVSNTEPSSNPSNDHWLANGSITRKEDRSHHLDGVISTDEYYRAAFTQTPNGLNLTGFGPDWNRRSPLECDHLLDKIIQKTQLVIFTFSSGYSEQAFKGKGELTSFASFNDSIQKSGWYNAVNASFGFQLSRNLFLTAGLGITQSSYKTTFNIQTPAYDYGSSYKKVNYANSFESTLAQPNQTSRMGLVKDGLDKTIVPGSDYILYSQFLWAEIPLGIRKCIPLSQKLTLNVYGGISGRFLLSSHSYVPSLNKGAFIEIDPTYANDFYRPNLSGFGGACLNLAVFDNFQVELGVEHLQTLSSIAKPNQFIGIRPVQTGIKLGIVQKM